MARIARLEAGADIAVVAIAVAQAAAGDRVCWQPEPGSQVSVVQITPSSQSRSVRPGSRSSGSQLSTPSHGLPLSQRERGPGLAEPGRDRAGLAAGADRVVVAVGVDVAARRHRRIDAAVAPDAGVGRARRRASSQSSGVPSSQSPVAGCRFRRRHRRCRCRSRLTGARRRCVGVAGVDRAGIGVVAVGVDVAAAGDRLGKPQPAEGIADVERAGVAVAAGGGGVPARQLPVPVSQVSTPSQTSWLLQSSSLSQQPGSIGWMHMSVPPRRSCRWCRRRCRRSSAACRRRSRRSRRCRARRRYRRHRRRRRRAFAVQVPPAQTSPVVQALPSSQGSVLSV